MLHLNPKDRFLTAILFQTLNFRTMFITDECLKAIELIMQKNKAIKRPVILDKAVSGGSINSCYRLKAGDGYWFIKVNSARAYQDIFLTEAQGLKTLLRTATVAVPTVIGHGAAAGDQFLLLEWIEQGLATAESWQSFGGQLANLHKHSARYYGLDFDNYIGSLPQSNCQCSHWTEFFVTHRLEPLLKMALNKGLISSSVLSDFTALFKALPELYPIEKPALLHGDLWSGNVLTSITGQTVLVDPAVYFGHREMDIAMTCLFGGFSPEFYAAYNEEFPLASGWQERLDIWNLYPLLVHLNLFGGAYLSSIKSTLKRYA